MTRHILFVCSNQNHVRMFTPVARRLLANSGAPVRWLALDRYYRHDAELALRANGWAEYALLPRPEGVLDTPWEGGALARMRVLRQGRQAVRTYLRNAPPGVVVLGNDLGALERLFLHQGHILHIPTLLIQDGVIPLHESKPPPMSAPRRLLRAFLDALGLRMSDAKPYGQNKAERIAVMGDAVKEWLAGQGVPSERIAVTGQPRYDLLHALRQGALQPESREALGLPEEQRVILFSSQPYLRYNVFSEPDARQIWRAVTDSVTELGAGHHLVAKLHPAENLEWTRNWLGNDFPPGWTLTRDADVFSLIFHADAVVTVTSSTALEAICMGKPVVILDAGLGALPIPYVNSGAALHASMRPGELSARLKEAMRDGSARARLASAGDTFAACNARADGRATERVAQQILELIGKAG